MIRALATVALLVASLPLSACGSDEGEGSAATEGSAVTEGSAAQGAPATTERPSGALGAAGDSLRPPSGAGEVDCTGSPDDPAQIDLLGEAAEGGELAGAIQGLEALCGAHPASSTARVRLGELLLRTQPPRAREAAGWFTRALALNARGCTLGYRDHWAALEGQALSHMMRGDYASAIPPLRRSLDRWPGLRSTHYNLACALCRTGDADGCRRELQITLSPLEPPPFLAEQSRPAGHYREMIRHDPDLALIREDRAQLGELLR